jgi:hypothetical protein
VFCDGSTTEEVLELNLFFLTACRKPYYPHSVLANSFRLHESFQLLSTVLYMWSLTVRPRPPKIIWTYNFKHHPLSTAAPPNVSVISLIRTCLGGDYKPVVRCSLARGSFTPSRLTGLCGSDSMRPSEIATLYNWGSWHLIGFGRLCQTLPQRSR